MRIGIHTSTAGALVNAAHKAVELGANCFQIFSASPRMWRATPPEAAQVALMKAARAEHDLRPLVIHDSYLINLAAADAEIRGKSIAAFRGELTRAIAIGAEYLVMHPGSAKAHETLEQALETLAGSLEQAARGLKTTGFTLLFENTAGGGATIGRTLEELKTLSEMAGPRLPFPTGLLPGHVPPVRRGLRRFHGKGPGGDGETGREAAGAGAHSVVHVNDSKGALNSHLDRHENIGKGHIGREGFRRILNHPKLRDKAFILETPIDNEGDDQRNVDTLKSLCRKPRTTTNKSN